MKYILAADDEEINREILLEIIEDDYEVKCVVNGEDCLKSIEERMPDLLLLDVGMPGIDGIEVCKRLRLNEKSKALPIFLLSGYASKDNISTGLNAGANKYISKPFRPSELIAAIEDVLD